MTGDYSRFFKVFAEVSKAIHSGEGSADIIESIVTHIKTHLKAKGCIFWVVDNSKQQIISKFSYGFSYRSLEDVDYNILSTLFVQNDAPLVFIEDARHDPRIPDLERFGKRKVGSISGLLFDIVGSCGGILAVYFHDRRELTPDELELVTALGEQGSIALQKAFSYDEKMMENLRQIVEAFTLALEAKDKKTHGHSLKVAEFAQMIAKEIELPEQQIQTVYHGGLLHDIGKIGMNDDILERLGILTRNEMDIVKKHPEIGARITEPLFFLNDVAPLIKHHHERFDGTGYPDGLKSDKIPLGARIVTVCDAFETMLGGRKHFEKMTFEDTVCTLFNEAGHQFDPEIVKALWNALLKHPEILNLSDSHLRCMVTYRDKLKHRSGFQSDMFI